MIYLNAILIILNVILISFFSFVLIKFSSKIKNLENKIFIKYDQFKIVSRPQENQEIKRIESKKEDAIRRRELRRGKLNG